MPPLTTHDPAAGGVPVQTRRDESGGDRSTAVAAISAALRSPAADRRDLSGIVFRDVSKRFGDECVLEDVSFALRPGSATALVGPNGAGKSTAIRLLLGLARPTSGAVLLDGLAASDIAPSARAIGAMTEALGLDPQLPARSFLRGMAGLLGLPASAADDALEEVGAASFATKRIAKLSLGMRQRVRLALALLPDAPYLVLDEPQNGLDPDGMAWLDEFLREQRRHGRTLVIATHHLAEADAIADDCVLLHRTVRYAGPITTSLGELYRHFR